MVDDSSCPHSLSNARQNKIVLNINIEKLSTHVTKLEIFINSFVEESFQYSEKSIFLRTSVKIIGIF